MYTFLILFIHSCMLLVLIGRVTPKGSNKYVTLEGTTATDIMLFKAFPCLNEKKKLHIMKKE